MANEDLIGEAQERADEILGIGARARANIDRLKKAAKENEEFSQAFQRIAPEFRGAMRRLGNEMLRYQIGALTRMGEDSDETAVQFIQGAIQEVHEIVSLIPHETPQTLIDPRRSLYLPLISGPDVTKFIHAYELFGSRIVQIKTDAIPMLDTIRKDPRAEVVLTHLYRVRVERALRRLCTTTNSTLEPAGHSWAAARGAYHAATAYFRCFVISPSTTAAEAVE